MKKLNSLRLVGALAASFALIISNGIAADSAAKPQEEILNNASVIELKGLGLGDSVIIDKIKTSKCNFDTSIDGLKQLKAAAVPDTVISAMLAAKSGAGGSAGAAGGQELDPDDPKAPHEAGIWLLAEPSGKPKMTKLEPSVYAQARTGGGFFMAYGATAKSRAVLRGSHAETTTKNPRPVFYFYFEKTESGLSNTGNSATSPNEFLLAQFEVSDKDNQRSLVMGELNAYSGGKSGADTKSVRSFGFEKLAPGIYKVNPKQELAGGEYGFFYGGNSTLGAYGAGANGGKVFDFAIIGDSDAPKPAVAEDTATPKAKTNFFKKIFHKKTTDAGTNAPGA